MKFRTELEVQPSPVKLDHTNRIFVLGSCFAEYIVQYLEQSKFRITGNPSGILFNPVSIASSIETYKSPTPARQEELHFDGELWFHYGFHGSLSAPTVEEALEQMNSARRAGHEALCRADRIIISFGTARIYERQGKVVANCHRQPAAEFVRRYMSIGQIVEIYSALLTGLLADKEVIFTVSPVRHTEGFEENAVSKAILRLAIEELVGRHPNAHYFPAYELLLDDLRDYRFYAEDMLHPSAQAVKYICDKFADAFFSPESRRILPQIHHITIAAAHHPRNPNGVAYREFCRRRLEEIAALPQIDFTTEADFFRRRLEPGEK